eukprot:892712_1
MTDSTCSLRVNHTLQYYLSGTNFAESFDQLHAIVTKQDVAVNPSDIDIVLLDEVTMYFRMERLYDIYLKRTLPFRRKEYKNIIVDGRRDQLQFNLTKSDEVFKVLLIPDLREQSQYVQISDIIIDFDEFKFDRTHFDDICRCTIYFNHKEMQLNNIVFFDNQVSCSGAGFQRINIQLTGDGAVALGYYNRHLLEFKDAEVLGHYNELKQAPIVLEFSSKIKSVEPIQLKIKSVVYHIFRILDVDTSEHLASPTCEETSIQEHATQSTNRNSVKQRRDDLNATKQRQSVANDDDRMIHDVPQPPRFPLAHNKLFRDDGSIDLEILAEHLIFEGRLRFDDAIHIIRTAKELFKKEPNLLRLRDPITIVGDIHGQYFDLTCQTSVFQAGGDPSTTQYIFLGNYTNKGCFGTECLFHLLALKIVYGNTFYMLRGNHDCRHLTTLFDFKDECLYKYNLELFDEFMNMFDCLPIAATVNGTFLLVHGGLSPDISSLRDIEELDRFQEVPREGPVCDLLWADPVDDEKELEDEKDDDDDDSMDAEPTTWFAYNETRQRSYVFGIDAVTTFLKKNNLTGLIRSNEPQFDGYKMQMIHEQTEIPRVMTVFSAPNFEDKYKNKGAVMKINNDMLNIRQFVSSPHPYYLPNFMDAFTWSLPFVAEKVTDMLYSILSAASRDVDLNSKVVTEVNKSKSSLLQKRGGIMKAKAIAVAKIMRMGNILKQNQKNINQLKQVSPNGQIPFGTLSGDSSTILDAISAFTNSKQTEIKIMDRNDV